MTCIHVVQLVIETQSPMAITTGFREVGFDTALVRDVNGLPMIPASAIAGVWSHLVTQQMGKAFSDALFGSLTTDDKDNKGTGVRSRLSISSARVHDQLNRRLPNYANPDDIQKDPILKVLADERPHHRERVSINDRGVAKDSGKFDQIMLPKGVRFSLSVYWNDEATDTDKTEAKQLLSLWFDRGMAFGSSTRNGLGQIKVVASKWRSFDLKKGSEQAVKAHDAWINPDISSDHQDLSELKQIASCELLADIPLQALDNWRCGTGVETVNANNRDKNISIITYQEPSIAWKDDKARWQKARPVLCGSSIKGILAHRVSFHWRCLAGEWAENLDHLDDSESGNDWTSINHQFEQRPDAVNRLFGFADEQDHDASQAGLLIVDDAEVVYEHTQVRTHNSIDRFTGGVRLGALFTEELLYQPRFNIRIWLSNNSRKSIDPRLVEALNLTLMDLQQGLLPMGAGSGRGASLVMADSNKPIFQNVSLLANVAQERSHI